MDGDRAEEAERWLSIAEKLLAARDLHGCKTFAIRARESDPRQLRFSDEIIAVADALIAGEARINNQHDWYAILQLSPRTQDPELVATHYRRLALLLNPNQNRFPFADQAFSLVTAAWSVLSNQVKKALYDHELSLLKLDPTPDSARNKGGSGKITTDSTHSTQSPGPCFWTACPYCYNLYEYPKVYEECVLRCQNCRSAFQAVRIPSPPAVRDGNDGYYYCWGFFPLGFSSKKSPNWVPFSPMFTCPSQFDGRRNAPRAKTPVARRRIIMDDDEFIEVSDPSDDSGDEWGSIRRKKKKAKSAKAKGLAGKVGRKAKGEKVNKEDQNLSAQIEGEIDHGREGLVAAEESVEAAPTVSTVDKNTNLGRMEEEVFPWQERSAEAPNVSKVDTTTNDSGTGTNQGRTEGVFPPWQERNVEGLISFFPTLLDPRPKFT